MTDNILYVQNVYNQNKCLRCVVYTVNSLGSSKKYRSRQKLLTEKQINYNKDSISCVIFIYIRTFIMYLLLRHLAKKSHFIVMWKICDCFHGYGCKCKILNVYKIISLQYISCEERHFFYCNLGRNVCLFWSIFIIIILELSWPLGIHI